MFEIENEMFFSKSRHTFEASCQGMLNVNSKALCEFNEGQ
jgi:hypothetical protein